jgi:hypothetical protein
MINPIIYKVRAISIQKTLLNILTGNLMLKD